MRRDTAWLVAATIVAAILSIAGQFALKWWYSPDVVYEEGKYYRMGNLAIVSLRLANTGRADALDVRVFTQFPHIIEDITVADPTHSFKILSGGRGSSTATLTFERLVPGQVTYVYFTVSGILYASPRQSFPFVSSVTYQGGQGRPGPSSGWIEAAVPLLFILLTVLIIVVGVFLIYITIYAIRILRIMAREELLCPTEDTTRKQ